MLKHPTDISVDKDGNIQIAFWDTFPLETKKSGVSFDNPEKLQNIISGDESGISIDTDKLNRYHIAYYDSNNNEGMHAFDSLSSVWERAKDADENSDVTSSILVFVRSGDTFPDLAFVLITNDPIDVGVDAIEWDFFAGTSSITAGDSLTKTPNRIDLNAGNASLEVLADSVSVQLSEEFIQQTIEKSTEGLRIGTANDGEILVGNSPDPTSFQSVSKDLNLDKDGVAEIQTAVSLIQNQSNTGGGIKLSKSEDGKLILGKGTQSGDPDVGFTQLSGDVQSVLEDGTVTVDDAFNKASDWYYREVFATDGTASSFIMSGTPLVENNTDANYKELIFLNGVLQVEGVTDDYTKPTANEIIFNDTPEDNGTISVVYVT